MPNYVARIGWPADAPSAVITWTAPTTLVGGAALDAGDIASTVLRVTDPYEITVLTETYSGNPTSATLTGLPETRPLYVQTRVILDDGRPSEWSAKHTLS
jgi:hypothetical protein